MWLFLVAFMLVLSLPQEVSASISVKVIDSPTSISENPFSVTFQVEGVSPATNYFRVDLFEPGSTNYFGETYTGSQWYGGSSGQEYFPLSIVSKDPQIATLSARLGEAGAKYKGPGSYNLRIRRYTASGSQGSDDPQVVPIQITYEPVVSPTPVPTTVPSPTSSPMESPSITEKPAPTKEIPPSANPSIKPSADEVKLAPPVVVYGTATSSSEVILVQSPVPATHSTEASLLINKFFLGVGLVVVSCSLYLSSIIKE